MSTHCPQCGDYCEEDDNRKCAKCAKLHWHDWGGGDDCPSCGNIAEVLTSCTQKERAYDGDKARCVECGHPGSVSVYGDDELDDGDSAAARIAWHDDPKCDCEWCTKDRAKESQK